MQTRTGGASPPSTCETVILPGFTHMQVAQPVSFAHHLLAYVEMFASRRRAHEPTCAAERVNRLPLGSAALAGTTYPLSTASAWRAAWVLMKPCQRPRTASTR